MEFKPFVLPELDTDKESILILAGDINLGSDSIPFITQMSKRFCKVIYVLGNHEYFCCNWNTLPEELSKIITEKGLDNVYLLENQKIIINDEFNIVGTTLWTDLNDGNPIDINEAKRRMRDYMFILKEEIPEALKIEPEDVIEKHKIAIKYLKENVDENSIVVTHHMPSYQCVHEKYKNLQLNSAFTTELVEFILEAKPKMWFHGHTHSKVDIVIGKTRIIANPLGYPSEYNITEFNPNLLVTL